MKLKFYSLFLIIGLVLSCTSTTVDEIDSRPKIYVSAHGTEDGLEGSAFLEIIDNFQQKYPEYNVIVTLLEADEYFDNLAYKLSNKRPVDIAYMINYKERLQPLIDSGQAIDQRQFIEESHFYDSSLFSAEEDNKMYLIPSVKLGITALYSNDKLLKELGLTHAKTYGELLEQQKVASENGKFLISYPGESTWGNNSFLYPLLVGRFGGARFTFDLINKKAKFTDSPSLKALHFIKKMKDDGLFSEDMINHDYGEYLAQFNNGNCLYYIDGTWRIPYVTLEDYSLNIFPSVPGEVLEKSTNGGFRNGYLITRSAAEGEQRERSILLLNYLLSDEAAQIRAKVVGQAPSYYVQSNLDYMPSRRLAGEFMESVPNITYTFDFTDKSVTNIESISHIYEDGIIDIWNNNTTPEKLAEEVEKAFK